MLWFWSALAASVLWGLSYSAVEYILRNGLASSALMAMFGLVLTPVYLTASYYNGTLQNGFRLLQSNPRVLACFLLIAACYGSANFLSYWSIQQKNATLSSLIEISYPLFVVLFSFLIFRQTHLTAGTLTGGAMILGGVVIMYMMD